MDKEIKKKLTRNWFINLQEMICNTIQQIEGGKIKFLNRGFGPPVGLNELSSRCEIKLFRHF